MHQLNSTDDFEGFGVITFARQGGPQKAGVGFFSDTINGRVENTQKKSFILSKCGSPQKQSLMREGTPAQRQELLLSKLKQLT